MLVLDKKYADLLSCHLNWRQSSSKIYKITLETELTDYHQYVRLVLVMWQYVASCLLCILIFNVKHRHCGVSVYQTRGYARFRAVSAISNKLDTVSGPFHNLCNFKTLLLLNTQISSLLFLFLFLSPLWSTLQYSLIFHQNTWH